MSNTSPSGAVWRKPSDVMKIRQLKSKKRSLQKRFGQSDETAIKTSKATGVNATDEEKVQKFSNPFRCSGRKRPRHEEKPPSSDLPDNSSDSTLFQLLQESSIGVSPTNACFNQTLESSTAEHLAYKSVAGEKEVEAESEWQDHLPIDWSLKTALRLTSPHAFPWSGRMSSLEESSGVTGFVRCLSLGGDEECALDTSPNAQLFQCCQAWCHPSLPWLSLFPRNQNKKITTTSSQLDPKISSALLSDWADSFRSLFHLVRARQCPYFYLCAHSFTVLFRASGVSGCPRLNALLTPTTKGLRAALSEEGIEFSMPLENEGNLAKFEDSTPGKKSQECSATQKDDDPLPEDETEQKEEEVVTWLKSVGVEGEVLAHIDRDVGLKSARSIDYGPQSLVLVEDGDVQALFNYLLNSSNCVSRIGPLVGIPPTLLSPVAFIGGTLRSLKIRQCQALQEGQLKHVLDITGPILPHVPQYIKELLSARSPDGKFNISFSTLEASTSFSQYSNSNVKNVPAAFVQQSLSDCGLLPQVLHNMCRQCPSEVLREVQMNNGQYLWS